MAKGIIVKSSNQDEQKKKDKSVNSDQSSSDVASSCALISQQKIYLDAEFSNPPSYVKLPTAESNHNTVEITPQSDSFIAFNNIQASIQNSGVEGRDNKNEKLNSVENCNCVNPVYVEKKASTYELERFEEKLLIIFNHKKFNDSRLDERIGTEYDVTALSETFKKFGFTVDPHEDLTQSEVMDVLTKLAEKDFSKYGCVCVAVLTHGSEPRNDDKESKNSKRMVTLWAKDKQYSESDIIDRFKMKSLLTKPKILLVQACRGNKKPAGSVIQNGDILYNDSENKVSVEHYSLPMEADMLILHSGYMGYPVHRKETGSWFVQAFCRIINEKAAVEDLQSIMTAVQREVAINKVHAEYCTKTKLLLCNKQMPVVTSTLIRKLYLRDFTHCTSCSNYFSGHNFKMLPTFKQVFSWIVIASIIVIYYVNIDQSYNY